LGQISLPVVNRSGIYSHWSSSGDNIYNYSKLLKQNIFMRILLTTFFKKKFFLLNSIKRKLTRSVDVEHDSSLTRTIYNTIKTTLSEQTFKSNLYAKLPNDKKLIPSNKGNLKERGVLTTLDLADLVNQKTATELPIYSGKVLFIKQQGALICLICYFQPPKGSFKAIDRRKKKLKRSLRSLNAARYLKFNKRYNPFCFYQNTF